MSVTRIQIADLVGDAFGPDGAETADLLLVARAKAASPAVLLELDRLPDRHFRHMRDLWEFLQGIPVD